MSVTCRRRAKRGHCWGAANRRLQRALSSNAPQALLDRARAQLTRRLGEYLDELVGPEDLQFHADVLFSARGVIGPGDLHHDQIGVPEEIAWILFAPLAARKLSSLELVASRSPEATALDEAMAENWVILSHPPTLLPLNFIAFQPVRVSRSLIRIHPLVTRWMNADFDGDQAALFVPITEAGQLEVRQQLSLASHFRRLTALQPKLLLLAPPRAPPQAR
jgi:hypothetical protein